MPMIYVSTYAKYNNGSLGGEWVNVENFTNKDDFLSYCVDLHSDEEDPELMFQDTDEIPEGYVSECHVEEELWDWLELSQDDREVVSVYRQEIDSSASIDSILDAYAGQADSEEDYAEQLVDELGYLEQMPEHLRSYFDYEAFARDLFITDYTFARDDHGQGYVFRAF